MPDTGNAKDCHPQISIFYLKKCELTNLFDQFHSTVMFSISFCLYRACLNYSDFFKFQLESMFMVTFDQLVYLNKEINANVYRHSLWEYSKSFHSSFEWHLTPHMTLSIKTCIRRTPCIKRTLQHSPRCPLNTGFTVTISIGEFRILGGLGRVLVLARKRS